MCALEKGSSETKGKRSESDSDGDTIQQPVGRAAHENAVRRGSLGVSGRCRDKEVQEKTKRSRWYAWPIYVYSYIPGVTAKHIPGYEEAIV